MKAVLDASLPTLKHLMLTCAKHKEDFGSGDRYLAAFTEKVVYALALWPALAQLESLDISGNMVGIDALRGLLGSPATASLKRLGIRRVSDGQWDMDDSLEALGFGPRGALEELDVGDNDLNQSAAHALAHGAALTQLKVLRMDALRSTHFQVLDSARWLHELRVLQCDVSALPPLLRKAPRKLHTLVVHATPQDDVAQALCTRPLTELRVLDLTQATLSAKQLEAVGTIDIFPTWLSCE